MNITLESLNCLNFKSFKNQLIEFGKVTNIYGDNGLGKTTIIDAFRYCLFGKDSKDRTTFEIKTLNQSGEAIPFLDHIVECVLNVDGQRITLKKNYKEKWNTKRGFSEKVFNGHETLYYVNDIPVTQKEYTAKIGDIIAEENLKLLTDPLYFSQNLKWQKAREILMEIVGDINQDDIIANNKSLEAIGKLLVDNDIDTLRKQIRAKINNLKKDKTSIPFRIDECNNQILTDDFIAIEKERNELKLKIEEIENKLLDTSNSGNEILKIKENLFTLKSEYKDKMWQAQEDSEKPLKQLIDKKEDIERKLALISRKQKNCIDDIEDNEKTIMAHLNIVKELNNDLEIYRNQYKEEANKKFHKESIDTTCPTCSQTLPGEDIDKLIEEMESKFEKTKTKNKELINTLGKNAKSKKETYEFNIDQMQKRNYAMKETIKECEKQGAEYSKENLLITNSINELKNNKEVIFPGMEELKDKITNLQNKINNYKLDNSLELKAVKNTLMSDLRLIENRLNKKDNNKQFEIRINELMQEEREIAERIAELEGQDFLCEEYIVSKVTLLEDKIKNKFGDKVNFKLFSQQINGGLAECCEATINGVPFSNANNASQINAGLSIINVLCEHYGVTAPIFIDNRESVNKIVDTNSQVINLIVTNDKKLKIEL